LNNSVYQRKVIRKCCELAKLCHSNRWGPVFLRHSVYDRNAVAGIKLPRFSQYSLPVIQCWNVTWCESRKSISDGEKQDDWILIISSLRPAC